MKDLTGKLMLPEGHISFKGNAIISQSFNAKVGDTATIDGTTYKVVAKTYYSHARYLGFMDLLSLKP